METDLLSRLPWRVIFRALIVFAPLAAFFLWRISYYGLAFSLVEEEFFGRGFLAFGNTFVLWADGFKAIFGNVPNAAAYYFVEWLGAIIGFTACIAGFKGPSDIAIFGFLVVFLSFTTDRRKVFIVMCSVRRPSFYSSVASVKIRFSTGFGRLPVF